MDAKALFKLDPLAGISYAQYNEVKKGKGSFEDFLLHYDSYNANKGKNDWLTNLISSEGGFEKIASSELLNSLDLSKFSFSLSTNTFLNTKALVFKHQALLQLQKKSYNSEQLEALIQTSTFKNPLLG